ncbi:polyubiquitin-B-like isoform X2 [Chanos chanos]|uniref:Polyubiquitin-B-like isoform X2 n=1 Tax=Chanos chanos TaxID=29144 RepID=A0A6J2WQZ1_CHACN|nr:polyubiquitin-B-like isoform X2 [Chanos chanos]
MELVIKLLTGETKTVPVSPYTTIGELKRIIHQHFNVPPPKQKLSVRNGHVITLDDDFKTVSQYGLTSGSVVMLLILSNPVPIQVFLRNEKGQTKTYEIVAGETVNEFKAKVAKREGVSVDQQRLIYEGKQLEDGRKLEDYNIQAGSTIYLTLRLRGG